jgi:large subunit ribosomal protein L24
MPIQLSNVMLVCNKCGQAVRVGARSTEGGAKERFCKKCGASNGQVRPKKARAKARA